VFLLRAFGGKNQWQKPTICDGPWYACRQRWERSHKDRGAAPGPGNKRCREGKRMSHRTEVLGGPNLGGGALLSLAPNHPAPLVQGMDYLEDRAGVLSTGCV